MCCLVRGVCLFAICLFVSRCALSSVRYSFFVVRCSLFVVACCLLLVGWRSLRVVVLVLVVCCLLRYVPLLVVGSCCFCS